MAAASFAATRVIGMTPRAAMPVKIAPSWFGSMAPCCWSTSTSSKPQDAIHSATIGSGLPVQPP